MGVLSQRFNGVIKERMRDGLSVKLCTCAWQKCGRGALSCSQAQPAEPQKLWGCSTSGTSPPDQFQPDLSLHRGEEARGGKKTLSHTNTGLATGSHQSRHRTTATGTNLLRSPSFLLFICRRKKKGKQRKNFCRGLKLTEQN